MTLVLTINLLAGCSSGKFPKDTLNYNELKDINIQLTIDKLETIEIDNNPNIFLYFNYQINNKSTAKVFFDPGKIRLSANQSVNTQTFYGASMGSAITEEAGLPVGSSMYYLYAVYPGTSLATGINKISIKHPGVTIEAFTGQPPQ